MTKKKEEVARMKAAASKKDSPPATTNRGYSTPFTSPTDMINTTIDLLENNNSYIENDITDELSTHSWDSTVINHYHENSLEIRNMIAQWTGS